MSAASERDALAKLAEYQVAERNLDRNHVRRMLVADGLDPESYDIDAFAGDVRTAIGNRAIESLDGITYGALCMRHARRPIPGGGGPMSHRPWGRSSGWCPSVDEAKQLLDKLVDHSITDHALAAAVDRLVAQLRTIVDGTES